METLKIEQRKQLPYADRYKWNKFFLGTAIDLCHIETVIADAAATIVASTSTTGIINR